MSKKPTSRSATRRAPSRHKKLASKQSAVQPVAEVPGAGHKRREKGARTRQDICPFCVMPFEKNELITQYFFWEVEASERLAHPACLVRVSELDQNKAS